MTLPRPLQAVMNLAQAESTMKEMRHGPELMGQRGWVILMEHKHLDTGFATYAADRHLALQALALLFSNNPHAAIYVGPCGQAGGGIWGVPEARADQARKAEE